MPDLLKIGTFASRKEAVEEMNECRSTTHPWCRSTVIPEDGSSLFHDRLKPISHHNLPECLRTTLNHVYVFSKPLLIATLSFTYFIHSFRVGEKINSPSEIDWNSIDFTIELLSIILLKL